MTILNQNKIKQLKDRLYKSKVSGLLKQGTKGLDPLEKYKADEKGRLLVPVQRIIKFFLDEMARADSVSPDDYFASLYALLREFSLEAQTVSYTCGFSVSIEKIQAADNKTMIGLLTTNIIITYFNSLKTYKGTVDSSLLSPGLAEIITRSNAGYDYKAVVDGKIADLTQHLRQGNPWRKDLEEINDTDLICRLTGTRLPPMSKEALVRILKKSRGEIKEYNELFTKILAARAGLVAREKDKKKYLKFMEKLDAAVIAILEKTDQYLAGTHRLMGLLDLSYPTIMGENIEPLRRNLTWLFLNAKPGKNERMDILKNLGLAQLRYRLKILFNYPDITLFASSFQRSRIYSSTYFDIFRFLFKTAVEQLAREETDMESIERTLKDLVRASEKLVFPEEALKEEKQALQKAYVSLILKMDMSQLDRLIRFCDLITRATQDRTRQIMVDVRPALISACYTRLSQEAAEETSAKKMVTIIKKNLNAYALNYKPHRDFYRNFFDTRICSGSQPVPVMAQLITSRKGFAKALLMVFSDETAMKNLMPEDRILSAASALEKIM